MKNIRWRVCCHVMALEFRQADLVLAPKPRCRRCGRQAGLPTADGMGSSEKVRSSGGAYPRIARSLQEGNPEAGIASPVPRVPALRTLHHARRRSWNELSPSSRGLALACEPAPRRDFQEPREAAPVAVGAVSPARVETDSCSPSAHVRP